MKTFDEYLTEGFAHNPKIGNDGELVISLSGSESKAMPIFNDISKEFRGVNLPKTSNVLSQKLDTILTKFKDKEIYSKFNIVASNLEEATAKDLAKKLTAIENDFIKKVHDQIAIADNNMATKLNKIDITKL